MQTISWIKWNSFQTKMRSENQVRKEMFCLKTHFVYSYMAWVKWGSIKTNVCIFSYYFNMVKTYSLKHFLTPILF